MRNLPSPFQTLRAMFWGNLRNVLEARGWALAALTVLPLVLVTILLVPTHRMGAVQATTGLNLFHQAFVPFLLPLLSLLAAPGGLREDIEQRTIPFLLVRPAAIRMLPLGKGLPWFLWGALWLKLATLVFLVLGTPMVEIIRLQFALVMAFWAQLAFMSLLTLVFKRGVIWGAIFLFAWDPLVCILPGNLQRLTFLHYIQSIAGSRGGGADTLQLLAQNQIDTPTWLAALLLFLIGAICWTACGYALQVMPIGLAGGETEG
jgi:hypothetical protein